MQISLPSANKTAWKRLLPWLILFAELAWLITYYAIHGKLHVNADMSSELVLANLLNQENSWLLSSNWYYSSELHVLHSQFVNKIALMLFSDWHAARTFSIAAQLMIMLGAYFYFAHRAKLPGLGVWAAVVFCAPLSGLYSWIMLIGNSYTPYMTVCFLGYGLAISVQNHFRKRNTPFLILDILVSIGLAGLSGLGGIRLILILYVPLAGMACLRPLWIRNPEPEPQALRAQPKWTPLLFPAFTAVMLITALCGFLYSERVLSKTYTFLKFGRQTLAHFHLDKILRHFGSITTIFGFQDNIPVFTRDGIQAVYSIAWFAMLLVLLIACFFLWKRFTVQHQGIVIFTVISLLANTLVNATTERFEPRYLIPSVIFCMIAGGLALHAIPKTARVYRQFACLVLCAGQLIVYMKPNFSMYHGDRTKALLTASAWLEQQGYRSGYATFWNSNVITEYTSGSIEMWTLSESSYGDMFKELILFDWLQEKSHMRRLPEGEVFVMLSTYEYGREPSYAQDAYLVYQQDGLYIFAYPSAEELNRLVEKPAS